MKTCKIALFVIGMFWAIFTAGSIANSFIDPLLYPDESQSTSKTDN